MDYTILIPEIDSGVATVTISRPKALNALNTQFFNELDHYLTNVDKDDNVKVVIITGEGKAFVAGADIAEMDGMSKQQASDFSKKGQDVFQNQLLLLLMVLPLVVAVNLLWPAILELHQ